MRQMQKYKEGVYLVDKPSGPSSHDIVNYFRFHSGIKRIGHAGTLDPLASGLLIILVGREFTKQQSLYLKQDKSYQVTARLGLSTDSYDTMGTTTHLAEWNEVASITKEEVLEALNKFKGEIQQTAPIFSAIKIKGQKLYDLARKGQSVELPVRQVRIDQCDLTDFRLNQAAQTLELDLEIACSSGTYIRSIVHDLGQNLKVGACVSKLRRTRIGNSKIESSIQLDRWG